MPIVQQAIAQLLAAIASARIFPRVVYTLEHEHWSDLPSPTPGAGTSRTAKRYGKSYFRPLGEIIDRHSERYAEQLSDDLRHVQGTGEGSSARDQRP